MKRFISIVMAVFIILSILPVSAMTDVIDSQIPEIEKDEYDNVMAVKSVNRGEYVEPIDDYEYWMDGEHSYDFEARVYQDAVLKPKLAPQPEFEKQFPYAQRVYATSIKTAEDFELIRNNPTGTYRLDNDIDFSGYSDFTPIENFCGVLNGNGFKIKNFSITTHNNRKTYGMFICLFNAVIKNLTFENASANTTYNLYDGYGIIAGEVKCAKIENCKLTDSTFSKNGGGLIGTAFESTIRNCTVENTTFSTVPSSVAIGGICQAVHQNSVIENCTVNNCTFGGLHAGGILNYSTGNCIIRNCRVNNCEFKKTTSGGIINQVNSVTVENCIVKGCVFRDSISGGIAGDASNPITIKSCAVIKCKFMNSNSGKILGKLNANGVEINDVYVLECMGCPVISKKLTSTGNVTIRNLLIFGQGTCALGILYNTKSGNIDIQNAFYEEQTIASNYNDAQPISEATLKSGNLIDGFEPNIWQFESGKYPKLRFESEVENQYANLILHDSDGTYLNTITVERGSFVKVPVLNKRTGYRFDFWSEDGVAPFDFESRVYEDATLYAVYSEETLSDGLEAEYPNTEPVISIKTCEDFNNIRNDIGKRYRLDADLDFQYFGNFEPIKNVSTKFSTSWPFSGVLDGNGHTISNLVIKEPVESGNDYNHSKVAIFEELGPSAVVKNINFVNTKTISGWWSDEAIIASNCQSGSKIYNCKLSDTEYETNDVGRLTYNMQSGAVMSGCSVINCIYNGSSDAIMTCNLYANAIIENCTIDNVDLLGIIANYGIVASTVYGTVRNCRISNCEKKGNSSGGIAYTLSGGAQVEKCYISGVKFTGNEIGGITSVDYGSTSVNDCIIENCSFFGSRCAGIVTNAMINCNKYENIYVKGCKFWDANSAGAVKQLDNHNFKNIIVQDCGIYGAGGAGFVHTANNSTISQCAVIDCKFERDSNFGFGNNITNTVINDCYVQNPKFNFGENVAGIMNTANTGTNINNVVIFGNNTSFSKPTNAICYYNDGDENDSNPTIITNSFYEDTIVSSKYDGMQPISTSSLKSGVAIDNFSSNVWNFESGEYPNLKCESALSQLYSEFTQNMFTVEYYDYYGNLIRTQQVAYAEFAEDIPCMRVTDKKFMFWSEDGTTPYDFNTPILNDVELRAVYKDTEVYVDFFGKSSSTYVAVYVVKGQGLTTEQINYVNAERDRHINKISQGAEHYRFISYKLGGTFAPIETLVFSKDESVRTELQRYQRVTVVGNNYVNTFDVDWNTIFTKPAEILVGETAPDNLIFKGWYAGDVLYGFNRPVTSDLLIEAKFSESTHNVKFFDADSFDESGDLNYELISSVQVNDGANASEPENIRVPAGYRFVGWNVSLENVSSDLFVYALYESVQGNVDVRFYAHREGSGSNSFIQKISVPYGRTLTTSNYPTPPNYDGYTFTGWSVYSITVSDANRQYVVIAEYEVIKHNVTFVDGNETEILVVRYNSKVGRTPQPRGMNGGEFIGWSDGNMTYTDVTEYVVKQDVTFTAIYEFENAKNFLLYDELKGEAVFGKSYATETLVPSSVNEIRSVYQSYTLGTVTDGYKFIGWFDKNGNEFNFNNGITERYSIAYAKYEVVKAQALTAPVQTIQATANLNQAIAQANAVAGTGRVEISLTTDAQITGIVDLSRANVTINGNGHTVTGIVTSSASGGLRIKADGLMLKDITWDTTANHAWAMRVYGNYTIYFDGTVNVMSALQYAAIHVTQDLSGSDVTATFIGISNDAVLNVTGGQSAAAIGSTNAQNSKSGKIVLRAGTFNLTGGLNAAAIGGAARGSAGDVVIRGNYVVEGSTEPIKLVVNAVGGNYGAAIGTGYLYTEKNKSFSNLIIADGAVVNAKAGHLGATFGSGKELYEPRGGIVTISGENTVVSFMGSQSGKCKDGVLELRGGSFFSSTQLNHGIIISGNEEKKLGINNEYNNLKWQNITMYKNPYLMNYLPENIGKFRIAITDSRGNEYPTTDTHVLYSVNGTRALIRAIGGFNFSVAAGDNNISKAVTLTDALLNAGYKVEVTKDAVKIKR